MTVERVVYGDLSINVSDPRLAWNLAEYNSDGDNALTVDDFKAILARTNPVAPGDVAGQGLLEDDAKRMMSHVVADAFERSGHLMYGGRQKEGIANFFDLYQRVKRFDKVISSWMGRNIDDDGDARKFQADLWTKSVAPHIMRGGDLTPEKFTQLSKDILNTIHDMVNEDPANTTNTHVSGSKEGGKLKYNQCAIPQELREAVSETVRVFLKGATYLFSQMNALWGNRYTTEYVSLECEGDGCSGDGVKFERGNVPVDISAANCTVRTVYSPPSSSYARTHTFSGFACFTGDTYLKTESGELISMREMAQRKNTHTSLPKVASYNECSEGTVYQGPTNVLVHESKGTERSILNILYTDSRFGSASVRVTPEHKLLALRNGGRAWVRAGELATGDELINPAGKNYTVQNIGFELGLNTLYNLSFTNPEGDMHPTYEVCPFGAPDMCIPAHNLK